MEKNPTDQSTPMKLLLMVPLSKPLFWPTLPLKKFKIYYCWMLPPYLWVLKPLVESWPLWSQETPPSQPKKLKLSPLMLITNPVSWFKSSKEKDPWPKITTFWVNSTLMVLPQPLEEFHKLKSHSISMKTVLWMSMPKIMPLVNQIKLLSPITKEDYLKKISKNSSKKLKNSKLKTKLLKLKLKPKMD